MAVSKIRGDKQIMDDTIGNAQMKSAAAIATSKLADGASFLQSGGSVPMAADLAMGSNKITGLAVPTADADAANKGYVDGAIEGLDVKLGARVMSDSNITLSAPQTIDSVSVVAEDRVLCTGQTDGIENGLYIAKAGAWVRSDDMPAGSSAAGSFSFIEEGTTYADSGWVCNTDAGSDVVGTDTLAFGQWSGAGSINAGTGLTKSGNNINAIGGNGITANANDLEVKPDTTGGANLAKAIDVNSNGVAVKVDASTINENGSSQLFIPDGGVTGTQINASVAGTGLTGGGGSALSIAAGGVTGTQLNASVAGAGLSGGGGSALALQSVDDETPSGAIDGANVTYTLTQTPVLLFLFKNGIKMHSGAGNDFTISGTTITMATAPISGDKLTASLVY